MKIVLFGMIIGIANIIPGVSGGTMAVILNIYDKIIASVSNLRSDFKNSLKFLAPLGVGVIMGIVIFANAVTYCIENFEIATKLAFTGLIWGSIPMIKQKAISFDVKNSGFLCFFVMLIIMIFMRFANLQENTNIITSLTVETFIVLFFASFISAGSMVIPGLSGSFVMLLLGTYSSVLASISSFNIPILIPVALGCAFGIVGCVKAIDMLFAKFPHQMYMAILGLMIGSIVVITPNYTQSLEFFIGILVCAFFARTSYLLSKK